MKKFFTICFLMILSACGSDLEQTAPGSNASTTITQTEYMNTLDCKSVGGFKKGDTCVSICTLCSSQEICIDTNGDKFLDTCVQGETPLTQPSDSTPINWCVDHDNDGFVFYDGSCHLPLGKQFGDCNEMNSEIHSGADEVCDGVDNDCDGKIDEDGMCITCQNGDVRSSTDPSVTVRWSDFDHDGYGSNEGKMFCVSDNFDPDYSLMNGDCAEKDPKIHPGAEDICDGIDNNCNGFVDDINQLVGATCACEVKFAKTVGQPCSGNFGACAVNGIFECTTGDKVVCSTDIGGSQSKVSAELCGDNLDNNCDGLIDENCTAPVVDVNVNKYAADVKDNAFAIVFIYPVYKMQSTLWIEFAAAKEDLGDNFVKGQQSYAAIDGPSGNNVVIYYPPSKAHIARFNTFEAPGFWATCSETKNGTFNFTPPTVYTVNNGVWTDVTKSLGMIVSKNDPNGDSTIVACSAALEF